MIERDQEKIWVKYSLGECYKELDDSFDFFLSQINFIISF
jgi:hypothetical protein